MGGGNTCHIYYYFLSGKADRSGHRILMRYRWNIKRVHRSRKKEEKKCRKH